MELGAFSISLAAKDVEASRAFYGKFGFKVFAGDAWQHWLILKERSSRNWSVSRLTTKADETSTGPASFTAIDPEGNQILVDQHV